MAAQMASRRIVMATTIITASGLAGHQVYRCRAHAESLPSDSKATANKMKWSGFTELHVHSIEQVNHNVKRITFILPSESTVSGLPVVSSMLSQHVPDGGFLPVIRPYTPYSSNTEQGQISFMVKKYPDGKASGKMHSLLPGDTMRFRPLNEYEYRPNEFREMLLIAGGSGITPIYQLLNHILSNPADKTKVSLIYANNREEDILLRKEIEALEKKHPRQFSKLFTVSNKADGSDVQVGYVDRDKIMSVFSKQRQDGQKVLVSGPPAMTEAVGGRKGFFGWTQGGVGGVLKELGYTKEDIHKF